MSQLDQALTKAIVLVPHLNGIEHECEQGLSQLGMKVWRRGGSSAIDVARSEMISEALHDGYESMMFIDADIQFDPLDVVKLINRPEPVVSGVYCKKGKENESASVFMDKSKTHLRYAAAGFLRIKASALKQMITELKLPRCNTKWGRGFWPFFQPMVISYPDNQFHYLGEDWAFSHRLRQIGIVPLADTSVTLIHWGRHGYTWSTK